MTTNIHNQAYISYLQDHPECLIDEPPHASSKRFWRLMSDEGRCTGAEMERSVEEARHRWEKYHLEKAKALGFEISVRRLHYDKKWLRGICHQKNETLSRGGRRRLDSSLRLDS